MLYQDRALSEGAKAKVRVLESDGRGGITEVRGLRMERITHQR